ncbi:hypothetical protein D3C81_1186600 [compost metagenome]
MIRRSCSFFRYNLPKIWLTALSVVERLNLHLLKRKVHRLQKQYLLLFRKRLLVISRLWCSNRLQGSRRFSRLTRHLIRRECSRNRTTIRVRITRRNGLMQSLSIMVVYRTGIIMCSQFNFQICKPLQ